MSLVPAGLCYKTVRDSENSFYALWSQSYNQLCGFLINIGLLPRYLNISELMKPLARAISNIGPIWLLLNIRNDLIMQAHGVLKVE